jgi:hypothetical protein
MRMDDLTSSLNNASLNAATNTKFQLTQPLEADQKRKL